MWSKKIEEKHFLSYLESSKHLFFDPNCSISLHYALCTTLRVASSSLDEVDKVVDWVAGLGQEGVRLGFKEVDLLLRHPPRHQTREGSHRPKMLEKYTFQILYSSFICRHVTKL